MNAATAKGNGAGGRRAILFDLDGTLIDSVPDITVALNTAIEEAGLETFSEAEVRAMVGHGIGTLLDRAYLARKAPLDGALRAERLGRLVEIYRQNLTGRTALMPGARDFIAASAGGQWRLALVTNKLQSAAETILSHFGLAEAFSLILGDSGMPLKPEPDMLLHAVEALGCAPGQAVMVGDGPADIEAARAAGIASIAVRGGYCAVPLEELGADVVISDLGELRMALDRLPVRA